ncbi:hypothetical protein NUH86_11000 [Sphingobium sp. JS3065]|uniref:hypothetical protein n=1 Tax=Sphingobium sp. JS3065 TaxID=2970925 RepID=UPI002265217E|nr:hypothetical protein [Sphingobium sp. JS3065]UZW54062.1 hypothetical protein NUH86_11000 [Sphingobium sp. JS3065]
MKVTALYVAATLCLLMAGALAVLGMNVDIAPTGEGFGLGETINFGQMHRQTVAFIGGGAFLISSAILFSAAALIDRQ